MALDLPPREEDARLQQLHANAHPGTSSRAAVDSIPRTMEVTRNGLTGPPLREAARSWRLLRSRPLRASSLAWCRRPASA